MRVLGGRETHTDRAEREAVAKEVELEDVHTREYDLEKGVNDDDIKRSRGETVVDNLSRSEFAFAPVL